MSTTDVPGANPANQDELCMGCWAEHADGSLIFVYSTEHNRVVYSIFDVAGQKPTEYRDAMPVDNFKNVFSWGKGAVDLWTWHDKTPFDWNRVMQRFEPGTRDTSADQTLNAAQNIIESRRRHSSAAERVAASLALEGRQLDRADVSHRIDEARIVGAEIGRSIAASIANTLNRMRNRPKKTRPRK
jgi:hypothetical protein